MPAHADDGDMRRAAHALASQTTECILPNSKRVRAPAPASANGAGRQAWLRQPPPPFAARLHPTQDPRCPRPAEVHTPSAPHARAPPLPPGPRTRTYPVSMCWPLTPPGPRTRTYPVSVCRQLTPGTASEMVIVRTLSKRPPRNGSVVRTRTRNGGRRVCSGSNSYRSAQGALVATVEPGRVVCCSPLACLARGVSRSAPALPYRGHGMLAMALQPVVYMGKRQSSTHAAEHTCGRVHAACQWSQRRVVSGSEQQRACERDVLRLHVRPAYPGHLRRAAAWQLTLTFSTLFP
jgi:hypothetical protein